MDEEINNNISLNITNTLTRDFLDGLGSGNYYLLDNDKYYKLSEENSLFEIVNPLAKKYKENLSSFIKYKNNFDGDCLGLIPLTEEVYDEMEKQRMIPKEEAELINLDSKNLEFEINKVMIFMPFPEYFY